MDCIPSPHLARKQTSKASRLADARKALVCRPAGTFETGGMAGTVLAVAQAFFQKGFTMYRMLSVAMVVVALLLVASLPMAAQDKADTHTGKFLSATGNSFKMEHPDGTEHSHKLALDAKVIGLDGKDAKIGDFRKGQAIRVTTKAGDKTTATKVEAIKAKE